MGAKREGLRRIDPAPRLFLVLVRYSLGWFEQRQLAEALGVRPSQISMWERGERPVPAEVLEEAAAQANISPALLALALRAIRSFLQATRGRGRGDRGLEVVLALDLLPALQTSMDVLLAPLRSAAEPVEVEELWAFLKPRTAAERLLLIDEGEEYQTRALHERVLAESAALAETEPRQAGELIHLAARIAELA